MGGYGSGRQSGKRTTDDMLALDIRKLHRGKLLIPGQCFNRRWSLKGKYIASINVAVQADHVVLSYCVRNERYEWETKEYPIPLAWTPCHLGGQRVWFLCPCCGRRVAILYGGKSFTCRHCHQLAYASQRENRFYRALRRARKIQDRLGWNGPCGWEKPKGMHRRTFERLEQEHGQYDRRCIQAMAERLNLLPSG